MMTITNTSAMPTAPTSRRNTNLKSRNSKKYIAAPRMNNSASDSLIPNSACQSTSSIEPASLENSRCRAIELRHKQSRCPGGFSDDCFQPSSSSAAICRGVRPASAAASLLTWPDATRRPGRRLTP